MAKAVANLSVSLTARTGQFQRAMRRAGKAIDHVRGAIGRVAGVASVVAGGGMGVLVGRSFQLIDTQAKVADRLNASQEQLAGLDLAARRAGVSTQTLQMGMQRMTRRIGEAAQGAGEAKGALKTLGLDAAALSMMTADQQFLAVADALDKVENGSQRVGLAMKIFDSEGVALLNAIQGGAAGLEESQRRAEQFGLAISRIDAAKIEEANDAIADVRDVFTGFANQIGIVLAPLITDMAESFVDWAISGDSAAIKVQKAINNYVLPPLAKIMDAWDLISGGIDIAIAKIQEFAAASLEKSKLIGGGAVAGLFGVDIDKKIAELQSASAENMASGKESLDRVFGATLGNLGRLRGQLSDVFEAAADRAAEKVGKPRDRAPITGAPAAARSASTAPTIGGFREVDLRRISLNNPAGMKQEVTGPELKQMVELMRQLVNKRFDTAVSRAI